MKKTIILLAMVSLLMASGCAREPLEGGMTLDEVRESQGHPPNQVFIDPKAGTITWVYINGNVITTLTFYKGHLFKIDKK